METSNWKEYKEQYRAAHGYSFEVKVVVIAALLGFVGFNSDVISTENGTSAMCSRVINGCFNTDGEYLRLPTEYNTAIQIMRDVVDRDNLTR